MKTADLTNFISIKYTLQREKLERDQTAGILKDPIWKCLQHMRRKKIKFYKFN